MHKRLAKSFESVGQEPSKLLCLTDILERVTAQIRKTSHAQLCKKFNFDIEDTYEPTRFDRFDETASERQNNTTATFLKFTHRGYQLVDAVEGHFEDEARSYYEFSTRKKAAARFMVLGTDYYSKDYSPAQKTEHYSLTDIEKGYLQETLPAQIKCYVWQNDLTDFLAASLEPLPERARFESNDEENAMTIQALERAQIAETAAMIAETARNAKDYAQEHKEGWLLCIHNKSFYMYDDGSFARDEKARAFHAALPNQSQEELIKALDTTPQKLMMAL